jgi:transcriptional regulator with XRE-family HTH domain
MPPSKRQPKPESFDQAWRAELKRLRKKMGWSQGTLGATAGYGQNYISNLENGKQDPRFSVVFNLVQTLGQRPDLYMSAVWQRTQVKPEKPAKPSKLPKAKKSLVVGKPSPKRKPK